MRATTFLIAAAFSTLAGGTAIADKIKNPTAVFAGLDKITGRIISFEVAVDETVQFGALQLTPRVCYSRPPTESPNTNSFVEVDEVTLENKYRRIFSGWMFASSPGLHGIEHAVYDVWLTDCKGGATVIAEPKDADEPSSAVAAKDRGRRGEGRDTASRSQQRTNAQGQLDVEEPRGREVRPSQAPSRRFFPTNQPSAPAPMQGYGGFNPGR
jgi:hypothetical protein